MNKNEDKLPDIVKSVIIEAPVSKVWDAVTTPEGMEKWWMASTIKPEAGFDFVLHTGSYGDSPCRVLEARPPNFLKFSWDNDWTITFSIKDVGDGTTEFTLTHSGWFKGKKSRFNQLHSDIRPVMDEGWENIVRKKLLEYVQDR